jgi:MoaA/NifB/PqqE/SkfB family radical SAM enzyme
MATASGFDHRLIPAICDVSVTNVCNATCDFCCYAHDKGIVKDRRWIDASEFERAVPILHRRGVRYLTFQGGEPLLHPAIESLVRAVRAAGMRPSIITNGWLLPKRIDGLLDAGLGTLIVSIDSHSMEAHERNRGLRGVGERIRQGLAAARRRGVPNQAVVTVNRLVDYERLPDLLRALGFDAVSFSYPRREAFGSTSLVYSEDSKLVDFDDEERIQAFEAIKKLRRRFPVRNPVAALSEMQRHVRGEEELFPCVGGYKYFYLDWNLDIWRCEAWSEPLGSVFDLDSIPDQRDRCTACTMTCYRDTSVYMHAGLAFTAAAAALARGGLLEAASLVFRRSVAQSLGAAAASAGHIRRLAPRHSPLLPPAPRAQLRDQPLETARCGSHPGPETALPVLDPEFGE